jgi:CubicO group peptidase (beta-lactamase class C family)
MPLLQRLALHRVALAQVLALACGVGLFGFLLTVSVGPYFQTGPKPGAPEGAFKAELDRSVPRILRHFHVPGAVVSTVVDGAPAQTYAYGEADVAAHRPMAADTVFRVASISKSLTAWGVLRLVQSGRVELDQPVARYLASWPLAPSPYPVDGVTVRRLLNHTAGVDAGEDTFHTADQASPSAPQVLATQGDGPKPGPATLVAPAGQGFLYSVPGYTLLQLMVERQTGEPFADYMQRQVFQPLGMASSSYRWDAALRGRTATAYQGDGKAIPLAIPDDAAADSLFATAPDLARFVGAPMADKHSPAGAGVLSAAMVENTYFGRGEAPGMQYSSVGPETPGLGIFVEKAPGQPTLLTNVGLDPGWSSLFIMSPATGDGVVILTNSDNGAPAIAQILSIWTAWRGLPASNLNSGYRWFGVSAAVFLSLLAALDVAYAGSLAMEISAGGRRRIGLSRRSPISGGLLELAVAATVLALWAGVFAAVRSMPTMHAVGVSVIGALVVLALARTLFPLNEPHGASKPVAVGA